MTEDWDPVIVLEMVHHSLWDSQTWTGGRVLSRDEIVVLYTHGDHPQVFGAHVRFDDVVKQILHTQEPTYRDLASEIAFHIAEPDGQRFMVVENDWARGLVPEPHAVWWRFIDEDDPRVAGVVTGVAEPEPRPALANWNYYDAYIGSAPEPLAADEDPIQ